MGRAISEITEVIRGTAVAREFWIAQIAYFLVAVKRAAQSMGRDVSLGLEGCYESGDRSLEQISTISCAGPEEMEDPYYNHDGQDYYGRDSNHEHQEEQPVSCDQALLNSSAIARQKPVVHTI